MSKNDVVFKLFPLLSGKNASICAAASISCSKHANIFHIPHKHSDMFNSAH